MIAVAGEDARFLAGGQSLVPMMNFRIARPHALVDLAACADLRFVRCEGGRLSIGAMVRQRDAERDDTIRRLSPLIGQALAHAGPVTIRNKATVGGTIANGYPVAELPTVALCLDAEIILLGPDGERRVAAKDFFIAGFVTAIETGELLREVIFPVCTPRTRYGFAECGNHAGGAALAIAAASAEHAADGRLAHLSIAAAGLVSIPVRLPNVETAVMEGRARIADALAADIDAVERSGKLVEADAAQRHLVAVAVEDAAASLRAPMETAA